MKRSTTAFFSVCTFALTYPVFASHSSGDDYYRWWSPLVVLIGLGLAKVLWDEFTHSMCEARKTLESSENQ